MKIWLPLFSSCWYHKGFGLLEASQFFIFQFDVYLWRNDSKNFSPPPDPDRLNRFFAKNQHNHSYNHFWCERVFAQTSLSRSFSRKCRATWLGRMFLSMFSLCSRSSFISLISSLAWTRHRKSSRAVYSNWRQKNEGRAPQISNCHKSETLVRSATVCSSTSGCLHSYNSFRLLNKSFGWVINVFFNHSCHCGCLQIKHFICFMCREDRLWPDIILLYFVHIPAQTSSVWDLISVNHFDVF